MDDLCQTPHLRSALCARVVGRDADLSVLLDHVAEAADGRGGVVFLVGEAGIGKSRLAQAAVEEGARRGFRALRGRAVPAATPIAYRALAEALSSAIRADPTFAPPELAPFRATLARLIPDPGPVLFSVFAHMPDRDNRDQGILSLRGHGCVKPGRSMDIEAGVGWQV